jgi:uncharacterized membrane protein HdeD (DUF308 family)
VLAVILGICVLVWPGISILVAATLFGLYLLITGIAQVIFAFALDVSAGSRILLFISGAASLRCSAQRVDHNDAYRRITTASCIR